MGSCAEGSWRFGHSVQLFVLGQEANGRARPAFAQSVDIFPGTILYM